MNVIVCIDAWSGWQYPAAGMSLANRLIAAATEARSVKRVAVLVNSRWATGLSGRSPIFSIPSSVDGVAPPTTMIWETPQPDQLLRVFRMCGFNSALVIGKSHLYVWPFMLDELFTEGTNKEYGLQETTWKELVTGSVPSERYSKDCKYPHDLNTLQYVYGEMASGAAWEEISGELEGNGKQESIPSEYDGRPRPDPAIGSDI